MLTREQRLKEREVKRILHEEELKKLEENSKNMDNSDARMSERNLKLEMERRQRELDKLAEEEDQWIFDCAVCGMHGENLDDGTHSIACEKCNIWQHSKCHGISEENAEREDFHFVCNDCLKKEEEAKKPKIPPLRLRMGASNSPQLERAQPVPPRLNEAAYQSPRPDSTRPYIMHGPALSPQGQSPGPPGYHPHGPPPVGVPQQAWHGSTLPPPARPSSASYTSSPPRPQSRHAANGNTASPPPFQLHQQAHASAVASASLQQPHPQQYQLNGHLNGVQMLPPSPQKAHSRPSSSYDPNARRTSLNGSAMTPHHHHHAQPHAQHPPSSLSYSPNTSFPPPSRTHLFQQAAGHSPTKLPSSSPAHPSQQPILFYNTPSNSQQQAYPPQSTSATPQAQMTDPRHNILRPSPGGPMHSSPIPPLPTGNTPLIPQKHDTPRPVSRESIGDIPVLPPGIKMSPSPASFARPASSAGGPLSSFGQSFSQSFGHGSQHSANPSHDTIEVKTGTPDKGAVLSQEQQARAGSSAPDHHHGEMVEGGGIAGVETEFGVGSVPVKKMPPTQSSPPPASPFSDFRASQHGRSADVKTEYDVIMKDS